jgi:hypothetical protein
LPVGVFLAVHHDKVRQRNFRRLKHSDNHFYSPARFHCESAYVELFS